ncbi:hypothetical protein [Gelidibacter maritimus]|uniref:PLAT domain-containing protein n=1 Tax=Gelidibacter maritimus TaxID=2761487 RepID=A0A7W2R651_9FLAO|nr:hypothetical protein [Gelidibacter maritimus]MBA6154825.1 hypothetical protein [Gelidibacter maritimus]
MKKIILLIILTFTFNAIAQDGSDIKYVSVSELDNSYVGKMAHLDFYNYSFGGIKLDNKDLTDKVTIELENKKIEFLEHRADNGHNNWFSEQYLESTKFIDGYKIRITMCEIEEITSDFIKVILFLQYKDKNGKLNSEKPNRIEYSFPKKILTEILIRN